MKPEKIKTRKKRVSKYLYVVEICKNGVWIDYTTTVPLCDALAAIKRIENWEV
jgi:hypothetical protein